MNKGGIVKGGVAFVGDGGVPITPEMKKLLREKEVNISISAVNTFKIDLSSIDRALSRRGMKP
jgi:hypothetical protein